MIEFISVYFTGLEKKLNMEADEWFPETLHRCTTCGVMVLDQDVQCMQSRKVKQLQNGTICQ